MRTTLPALLLLIFLLSGCASRDVYDPASLDINHGNLPVTDLSVNIDGLGPCTDNPNRTLNLNSNEPTIILAHGCFGSSGRFRALAEVFAFHGQQTVCFSYNDRDSLTQSSSELIEAIRQLGEVMSNKQFTIIGHSQGGLISRKALISDRENNLQNKDVELRLITISAPFSGIEAASHCGSELGQVITLGLIIPICYAISGDKWHEITFASDFIQKPGTLIPQVNDYLKIVTDERNTCRRYDNKGQCIEDDYVFSIEEQYYPDVDKGTPLTNLQLHAGHAEIIGNQNMAPTKLIEALQKHDVMKTTIASQKNKLNSLLAHLYDLKQ